MATLRKTEPEEWHLVRDVAFAAFEDLERRQGEPPTPIPPDEVVKKRFSHLIETDRDGAWLAEEDGRAVGAALSIRRESLWGLSLLVVHPSAQSGGVGRALLEKTLEYADGARGGIIMSSGDTRALRAYARAGFALHPAAQATGVPRPLEVPASVRQGSRADSALLEAVDRAVRGAAHTVDLGVILSADARMLVIEGRGYAVARGPLVYLLAATDEGAARDLLRAVIATAPEGESVKVEWITSAQNWAIEVVLDAGLDISMHGAQFLRGDVGPFRPYLPSGAYL